LIKLVVKAILKSLNSQINLSDQSATAQICNLYQGFMWGQTDKVTTWSISGQMIQNDIVVTMAEIINVGESMKINDLKVITKHPFDDLHHKCGPSLTTTQQMVSTVLIQLKSSLPNLRESLDISSKIVKRWVLSFSFRHDLRSRQPSRSADSRT